MSITVAKSVATATAVAAGGAAIHFGDVSDWVLGVPLNVVAAACLGAFAGLAWGAGEPTRWKVFTTASSSVIIACAMTAVVAPALAHFFNFAIDVKALAPTALVISYFGRRWVPAVNDRIGQWLDNIPFIGKKQ